MPVTVTQEGALCTLTLNRPERGNALGAELVEGIEAGFDQALAQGARLVVLRGAGKHFCTGLDLSDLDSVTEGDLALRILRIELLLQKLHAAPVTTMAIAGGRVFGAGADLFAVCDHRVALAGSSFAFPGPAFGLVLGTGRLAGLVGDTMARHLLLAGTPIPAQRALELGLATEVSEAPTTESVLAAATRLDAGTVAALHRRTRRADDAGDLAALAASVARPGLLRRVKDYRARVMAERPAKGQ